MTEQVNDCDLPRFISFPKDLRFDTDLWVITFIYPLPGPSERTSSITIFFSNCPKKGPKRTLWNPNGDRSFHIGCDGMVTCLVHQGHPHPEKDFHEDWWSCCWCSRTMAGWTGKLENKEIRNITSNAWSRRLRMSTGGDYLHFPTNRWHWDRDVTCWCLECDSWRIHYSGTLWLCWWACGEITNQREVWSFTVRYPMSTCFDPGILWHFFMSALKDLWKDGNSEKRFDPTQLDVTGYSLGGQATWVLWSFYGSCLDPWLHAWELDSSAHDTTKILRHLPVRTYACKWDFKAFSHEDHWCSAEHRGLNMGKKWSGVKLRLTLTLGPC